MLRNFILLKVQIFNYQLWKVVLVKQRAIEYEKLILHYLIANLIVKHESLFLLTTAQKRSSIHSMRRLKIYFKLNTGYISAEKVDWSTFGISL
jgi:hypothetical protein